jgi:two-component system, OmpR family, sensor kinase
MRLPIRVKLAAAFSLTMAVLLAVGGTLLYAEVGRALLGTTDNALRAQAGLVQAGLGNGAVNFADQGAGSSGVQTFAQVLSPAGRIIESSAVVRGGALVTRAQLLATTRPAFSDRIVRGVKGTARLLVVPTSEGKSRVFVVVGASLAGRSAVLSRLMLFLLIGGPTALALAAAAGWGLAGAAFRPIERMRSEAEAISLSEPDRRLPVSPTRDEVARLGTTLNSMLDRLQGSIAKERRFMDEASHELRTPLSILKTELELGLTQNRTPEEVRAALGSAREETDRLVDLADDLLVYSRQQGDRAPLERSDVRIDRFLRTVSVSFQRAVAASGVAIDVRAPAIDVRVDEQRLRQAVANLLGNAVAHTPPGGRVTVTASVDAGQLTIAVEDTGSGFELEMLERAFEPFARGSADRADDRSGAGLGLAIVRAVAVGHGGAARAENRPTGGARVSITLPST